MQEFSHCRGRKFETCISHQNIVFNHVLSLKANFYFLSVRKKYGKQPFAARLCRAISRCCLALFRNCCCEVLEAIALNDIAAAMMSMRNHIELGWKDLRDWLRTNQAVDGGEPSLPTTSVHLEVAEQRYSLSTSKCCEVETSALCYGEDGQSQEPLWACG